MEQNGSTASSAQKAWRVTINSKNWKRFEGIVAASTRGRAMSLCWGDAQEAGYRILFTNFRAVRAPEYDDRASEEEERSYLGFQDRTERNGVYRRRERMKRS